MADLLVFICKSLGNEAVADPGLGLDVLTAGFGLEFFAQLPDEDAEILRLMGRLGPPHGREQGTVGDDLAGVAGKVKEEFEFLRRKVQRPTHDLDAVCRRIDDEVAGGDCGLCALGGAAEMSTYAGKEFLNVEGLGYVVVGAGIESFDLGAFVVAYGEDEHRGR